MFEADFTYILSKSLMNTRTSREPRHAIRVVEVLLFCDFYSRVLSLLLTSVPNPKGKGLWGLL